MSIKIIPAILVCLVLGFILGIIPFVNEHLHWNLWFILPISGLIIGAGMGCVCFWICFGLNQRIEGFSILILAISAALGYVAVDYGIYYSTYIPIYGVEEIPDGEYKLSEIISFGEYMRFRLGSSSISFRGHTELFELGSAGTTISYVIDLIGALLGAAGALFACSEKYPYCDNCSRFKTREKKYKIIFQNNEKTTPEVFSKIANLIDKSDYKGIISYFQKLSESFSDNKGDIRIIVDQRYCSMCREATILGNVYRRVSNEWKEVDELRFSFVSEPGVHVSLLETSMQIS